MHLLHIIICLRRDRAVKLLMQRSNDGAYDLYSQFGCALGTNPGIMDEELNSLKVAVLPLPGGEFYHYGTSPEIISSTLAIQNLVNDQREIMHHSRKPHSAMFIQNAITEAPITENNQNLWVENSFVGRKWVLSHEHIITGVPENDWDIHLRPNDCIDMVPVGEKEFVVRPYGFNDPFRGGVDEETTLFLGRPLRKWAEEGESSSTITWISNRFVYSLLLTVCMMQDCC